MKKSRWIKFSAGVLIAGIFVGVLFWLGAIEKAKLEKRLSDGTIIRIEKVEISKEPVYDARGFWLKTRAQIEKNPWGDSIFRYLKIQRRPDIYYDQFRMGTSREPELLVWYSVSNPARGFYPSNKFNKNICGLKSAIHGRAFVEDTHGCRFEKGEIGTWRDTNSGKHIHYLKFDGFNREDAELKITMKFPGEKESLNFTARNPNPTPATAKHADAAALPVEQKLPGGLSLTLNALKRKTTENSDSKTKWTSEAHFKKAGKNADKQYSIEISGLSDCSGGASDAVCGYAEEWILKGIVSEARIEAIDLVKRVAVVLPAKPNERECVPLKLENIGAKLPVSNDALLLGAGGYLFADGKVFKTFSHKETKDLEEAFQEMWKDLSKRGEKGIVSNDYWSKKTGFYWKQFITSGKVISCELVTNRPALLLQMSGSISDGSAVLLETSDFGQQVRDANEFGRNRYGQETGSRWIILPIAWNDAGGAQTVEIGLAEPVPFEFHLIPSDEMRRMVLPERGNSDAANSFSENTGF